MQTELTRERKFWSNGNIRKEEFLNSYGKLHNEAGPAHRRWHKNGQLESEAYYLNGKLHNDAGPAYREWHENGKLACEAYWLEDKLLTFQALLHECSAIKESSC
jgi:antitoxin component YwqK of YwqJK toxin-antitoxin module